MTVSILDKEHSSCSECGHDIFLYDDVEDEIFCANCGLMQEIEVKPPWRIA